MGGVEAHRAPQVSVVVTTRNRASQLAELFDGLAAQAASPETFEVIVVDDGSNDDTPDVIARETGRGRLRLGVIRHEASGGAAAGREAGWRRARAPLVAFTDDDCVPAPDWLEVMIRAAAENPGCVIQGRTSPRPDQLHLTGPYSRTMDVQSLSPHFPTTNILYPRATLEAIGGFDVESYANAVGGEDTDLAWRAVGLGADPVFAPDSHVLHAVNVLGPRGKLRVAARHSAVLPFAHHPGSRAEFVGGIFRKLTHRRLVSAVAGLAFARRTKGASLTLAVPYARELHARSRLEGGGWRGDVFRVAYDCVEIYATVRGGIRGRRLMI